jgi:hypothetical protein
MICKRVANQTALYVWFSYARVTYEMYFEVANLRLGRGGEKPLE